MAKYQWLAGSTDRTIQVFIQDSSSTTGAGLSGLVAADLNCRFIRAETDNDVTIAQLVLTDLTALTDAHSDGGFKEIDSTNAPGWYRLDLSDAVLATGAWSAGISIIDAAANDVAQWTAEIELVAYNSQDAVRLGLSALPNASPATNGGLPTVNGSNFIAGQQGTLNTLDQLDASQDVEHDATQVLIDALPTNAELTTALAGADDATLTAIAALVTDYLSGIKTKTDQLTFTVANVVDSNIKRVNSTQVIGTGAAGNTWGPP